MSAEEDALVVESFGRRVIVQTAQREKLPAELFGKRMTVVCGDQVQIRRPAGGSDDVTRVTRVAERRTLFARTDSRGRTEPLAANLDLLLVIVAPEPEPDPYITDRYLAGAALAGVEGAVVLNKSELKAWNETSFLQLRAEYEQAGYRVLSVSALRGDVDATAELINGGRAMLVGQSGVGKSTLTNQLCPSSMRPTRTLSDATREGRHTTVSTALFELPGGGAIVDAPGVRDYAPPLVEDAMVQVGFREILAAAPQCRFNNCLHLREPGCAIIAAVAANALSPRRYESYKRLLNIMRQLAPDYERRR